MLKKILVHGLVAGLIAGASMFVFTVATSGRPPSPAYGMAIGYLTMLIALSVVFVAVKRHRDRALGGVIPFWTAFGIGLAISVVAGVVYVLVWEATLAITRIDFAAEYGRMLVEQQKAEGLSGAALAAFEAEMERFRTDYADPLYRLPMTFAEIFPVGVLVSLVSAALLRNPRVLPVPRG